VRISFDEVSKRYGGDAGGIPALSTVQTEVESGGFVSIVGPSGCGKSTLLRLVAGLIEPTTGSVRLDGEVVKAPRREVGIVFQKPVLLPWRTVVDNLLLPVDVVGGDRAAHAAKVDELLAFVGLSDFAHRFPGQLSGGMQQRVAICRALMLEPQLLLMDEPFGALDAITRETMGVDLLEIWRRVQATVVFITHSIPEAAFLSDRVLVMSPRPGQLVGDIAIDFERPRTLDLLADPDFGALTGRIRALVEDTSSVTQPARRMKDATRGGIR
jgi:NitT/TauT family transport system ATP-binding protein